MYSRFGCYRFYRLLRRTCYPHLLVAIKAQAFNHCLKAEQDILIGINKLRNFVYQEYQPVILSLGVEIVGNLVGKFPGIYMIRLFMKQRKLQRFNIHFRNTRLCHLQYGV